MKRSRGATSQELVYWVDRCLGVGDVPNALRASGATVRLHRELYPSRDDLPDAEWIPEVASRGWVIITKDTQITRNPIERRALEVSDARYVSLVAAGLSGKLQAECLATHFRTIDGVLRARTPPTLLKVTRGGVFEWRGEVWAQVKRKL